ncbi:uncharacterized protein LOC113866851 [Abrus precatorius]|uniref:Uncharacterized protein LOC113866851 n=1 Tax=Abrus precatorius TaxID=3816 RepID=A0A8B8LM26_ABRPR|nr:uncharacterized protein LOC113866851 [Abrus precatorius]
MAGRGRPASATNEILARMVQVLENLVQNTEPAEYRGISSFIKHKPPKFEGKFGLEGVQRWIADIKKMFNTVGCHEEYKVVNATYMLGGEAEDWWRFASQTLPQEEGYINWEAFKACFLGNYFPRDLKKQKVQEFLELKQGNMSMGEYVAKFHKLMKYWPHFQYEDGDEDLCAQFENGLRPEIRATVSVFQLTDLATLVNKC